MSREIVCFPNLEGVIGKASRKNFKNHSGFKELWLLKTKKWCDFPADLISSLTYSVWRLTVRNFEPFVLTILTTHSKMICPGDMSLGNLAKDLRLEPSDIFSVAKNQNNKLLTLNHEK